MSHHLRDRWPLSPPKTPTRRFLASVSPTRKPRLKQGRPSLSTCATATLTLLPTFQARCPSHCSSWRIASANSIAQTGLSRTAPDRLKSLAPVRRESCSTTAMPASRRSWAVSGPGSRRIIRWNRDMEIVKSIGLFVVAGLCEIGGGYLVWQWLREGKSVWMGLIGGVVLVLYGI